MQRFPLSDEEDIDRAADAVAQSIMADEPLMASRGAPSPSPQRPLGDHDDDRDDDQDVRYLKGFMIATTTTGTTDEPDSPPRKAALLDDSTLALLRKIESVLPNFRDLAASSCSDRIKPWHLFRSARPFGDSSELQQDVFVRQLKVSTIIDLRDDCLLALREEEESRLRLSKIFTYTHLTQKLARQRQLNAAGQPTPTAAPPPPPASVTDDLVGLNTWRNKAGSMIVNLLMPAEHAATPPPQRNRTPTQAEHRVVLESTYRQHKVESLIERVGSDLPLALAVEIASDPDMYPLYEVVMQPTDRRQAVIVNVLDAPAVKRRVLEHAIERAHLPYLPVVVAARAIDKITGVNSLAPYYFCRFVVSSHGIENTYFEMIDHCGANLGIALKVIALAPPPILFHCTLGKDRTGILAMLLMCILGVSEQGIIFDYVLTEKADSIYHKYCKKFIVDVSGLPESFCSSSADIMRLALDHVKSTYESVEKYLDGIGVHEQWREFIRYRFLI